MKTLKKILTNQWPLIIFLKKTEINDLLLLTTDQLILLHHVNRFKTSFLRKRTKVIL